MLQPITSGYHRPTKKAVMGHFFAGSMREILALSCILNLVFCNPHTTTSAQLAPPSLQPGLIGLDVREPQAPVAILCYPRKNGRYSGGQCEAPPALLHLLTVFAGEIKEPCSGFRGIDVPDSSKGLLWQRREHHECMQTLISPAPRYADQALQTQWQKKKKQTLEERQAAKRAKLDPASHKSAKDVMDENARKRKRELEGEAQVSEAESSDLDMDIEKEKPLEGIKSKTKKQKTKPTTAEVETEEAEGDGRTLTKAEAKAEAKAEKRREKRKEKQTQKKQKDEAKKAKQAEFSKG